MEKCHKCSKTFTRNSNLLRHIRESHSTPKYNCDLCEFSTGRAQTFNHHKKTHEKITNKTSVVCGLCQKTYDFRKHLQKHYADQHNITLEEERLEFSGKFEFFQWKNRLENDEKCHFVKYSRGHSRTSGSFNETYTCFRDGNFKSTGTGKRNVKRIGSNKINCHCPARIKATYLKNGTVSVVYFKTHIGHKQEVGRMRLRQDQKQEIANKIAQKIPFNAILDSVRSSLQGDEQRDITNKDLHNICNQFKLKAETINHSNNSANVHSWVEGLINAGGLVRLYKPRGQLSDIHPQLQIDDFILIVMNDAQIDLLKRCGQECICVESVDGTNQYGCKLTTILILDEMHEGFPGAFMFYSAVDRVAMEVYFGTLQDEIGVRLSPNVFMSDTGNIFYHAWLKVMGPAKRRLFSSWHVDQAWRNNLPKIKSGEGKKSEVYTLLKALMEERNEEAFLVLFEETVRYLTSDPVTQNFGTYFEREYRKSVESWAFCYRQLDEVSSNMHLERTRSVIEHIYLKGNKRKRLDIAFHSLSRFLRDKTSSRTIHFHEKKFLSKQAAIKKRHQISLKLDSASVISEGDSWKILSSNCSDICIVKKNDEFCQCTLRCLDCNICIHSFICTCSDSSLKFNICKHIHLVSMALKQDEYTVEIPVYETEDHSLTIDDLSNEEQQIIINELQVPLLQNCYDQTLEEHKKAILQEVESILNYAQSDEDFKVIMNTLKTISLTLQAMRHKPNVFSLTEPPPLKLMKINHN